MRGNWHSLKARGFKEFVDSLKEGSKVFVDLDDDVLGISTDQYRWSDDIILYSSRCDPIEASNRDHFVEVVLMPVMRYVGLSLSEAKPFDSDGQLITHFNEKCMAIWGNDSCVDESGNKAEHQKANDRLAYLEYTVIALKGE